MRCPGVPFDPGPSHGGQAPSEVICHRTYGSWNGDYAVGKGARGSISFHFLVGQDEGQWVQFVDTEQIAYHAKGDNTGTIGIEVTGTDGDVMTDWQVSALGHICRWISAAHGIPLVHYQGGRTSTFNGWRDHNQVAGSDHTDYWSESDWARIVAAAGGQEDDDMTADQAAKLDAIFAAIGRIDAEGDGTQSAWSAWMQHLENIEAAVARIEAALAARP